MPRIVGQSHETAADERLLSRLAGEGVTETAMHFSQAIINLCGNVAVGCVYKEVDDEYGGGTDGEDVEGCHPAPPGRDFGVAGGGCLVGAG